MALSKDAQNLLVEATRLIGIPGRWIQDDLSSWKREGGKHVSTYCAYGAVEHANATVRANGWDKTQVTMALERTCHALSRRGLVSFNDTDGRTQDEVKQIFCETVKRECTEEAPDGSQS